MGVELLVVQHCQSEHHVNDLTGGWTDTPLTDLGRQQAAAVGRALAPRVERLPLRCYSSDLLRASQTAQGIGREIDLDLTLEPDLREHNNGIAADKTKDWARDNEAPRPSRGFGVDRRPFPEAETPREFFTRVSRCVDRLVSDADGQILLVGHGGSVGVTIAWWLETSAEQHDVTSFATIAGGITTLTTDELGRRALRELSSASHLRTT